MEFYKGSVEEVCRALDTTENERASDEAKALLEKYGYNTILNAMGLKEAAVE